MNTSTEGALAVDHDPPASNYALAEQARNLRPRPIGCEDYAGGKLALS
jgi:hypothetical protein